MQQVAVSHGKVIELLRPDASGKVQSICSMECFGLIRSMVSFRLPDANKDFLVLGSDSVSVIGAVQLDLPLMIVMVMQGRISVLEFNKEKNQFERVHLETFGKSGCRRIVPGQFLAADPKGRAVMIGAAEKQKLVRKGPRQ